MNELDPVIHQPARLQIMSALCQLGERARVDFSYLKDHLGLTDGNLSRHMQVLQEAGLIDVAKSFENSRPQTTVHLTAEGHKRYVEYLTVLEQVVRDAATAVKEGRTRVPNVKQ